MRNLLFVLAAVAVLAFVPAVATAQMSGAAGFQRSSLTVDGDVLANFANPSPGVAYAVPMNASTKGAGDETWGLQFGTSFLADEACLVSNITAGVYVPQGPVRFYGGLQGSFLEPNDGAPEALGTANTNLLGPALAIRFDAQGLPAELGGSWCFAWEGVDNAQLRELHLGLVGQF